MNHRIDELFFSFEKDARKRERRARTARAPKCRCGNCISAEQTLCSRCERRHRAAEEQQRRRDFVHDLMAEREDTNA